MTEKELHFLALCAPLEDAIDLIEGGETDAAEALLQRILVQCFDDGEEAAFCCTQTKSA
ncbi:MAG: hypothetical protein LKJ86_02710 [Oscillibacter sp.]|jgi:hypothetical protein|nr:hypothetical protein [Oscillibacter sp.]